MKTEVREARLEDCKSLAERMDEEGRELIRKYWEVEPLSGLIASFRNSVLCRTILIDGQAAGMFGCTNNGQVWLTTAPEIEKAKLRFIRQANDYLAEMKDKCGGKMYALAHMDNTLLLKWLEWAGFEIVGSQGDFKICVCR